MINEPTAAALAYGLDRSDSLLLLSTILEEGHLIFYPGDAEGHV